MVMCYIENLGDKKMTFSASSNPKRLLLSCKYHIHTHPDNLTTYCSDNATQSIIKIGQKDG